MFKRVEKRRRKKEEEEELGLDENMKEILGMHDTDSEESASDSDDSNASDNEDEDIGDEQEELKGEGESDGAAEDDDEEGGESGGEEDEDADEDPNVTVSQALADPIYVVSIQPEVKACILCPGKLLKGVKMVQLHRISKACALPLVHAHERRTGQFKVLAANAEPEESAWEILQRSAEEKPKLSLAPSGDATSKRAEKKKARAAALKLRREKMKDKRAKEAEKKKKKEKALAIAGPDASSPNAESASAETSTTPLRGSNKLPKKEKIKVDLTSNPSKTVSPPKKRKVGLEAKQEVTIKVDSTSNPTKLVSPPKKKQKIEQEAKQTATAISVLSTPNDPSSPKKPRKPKHKKAESDAIEVVPPNDTPIKEISTEEVKDMMATIARSISDRTKNARMRALATPKPSTGDAKRSKRKGGPVS